MDTHNVPSTFDEVSTQDLGKKTVFKAEELAFGRQFNLEFQNRINYIVSSFQLSSSEISGYMAEHFERFTENEVSNYIESEFQNDSSGIISFKFDTNNEIRKSRKESLEWLRKNSTLADVFTKSRQFLNNIIVDLKRKNALHYYQIYGPSQHNGKAELSSMTGTMFSSNDYLGLSRHPKVIQAAIDAANIYGLGGKGSRISVGTTTIHFELENELAKFKKKESSVVLSSGFLTYLTVFSLLDPDTIVLFDSLSHASMISGIQFAGVRSIRFRHNNMEDLEKKLKQIKPGAKVVIAVESIYSLDGDIAPLLDINQLAKNYGALLLVDEAHSTGTLGNTGKGISEYFNLPDSDIDFKVGTLSKALGSEGGFVCAKQRITECLKYHSGPYMFTTSRSPVVAAGAFASLKILNDNPELANQLQHKASEFRNRLNKAGFNTGDSQTQIIPIMIGDCDKTIQLQKALQIDNQYTVAAIYPTVPPKKSRLRVNISLDHSESDLEVFLDRLIYHSRRLKIL